LNGCRVLITDHRPRLEQSTAGSDYLQERLLQGVVAICSAKAADPRFPPRNIDVWPRLGPGPVFTYEWLRTTRCWQLYAIRAGFVGAILIGMMFVWQNVNRRYSPGQNISISTLASYGQSLFATIVSIELTLVLLAAPAATAGAVCLDKARGTLDHMLVTDLSNAEIVLGKLGAQLVPVLSLIACVLPLAALAGLLGGIDPTALFGSFLTSIACAFLGCSLALTLSVWGRKTHEVLMLTYLILILWLGSPLLLSVVMFSAGASNPWSAVPMLWELVTSSNPYFLVHAPASAPGKVDMATYLSFLGACLCVSAVLMAVATSRIRAVVLTQAGKPVARSSRFRFVFRLSSKLSLPWLPTPSLDGNPVLWREWHRSRPSGFIGMAWFLYSALGAVFAIVTLNMIATARGNEEVITIMSTFQVAVGLLLLSVGAATTLAEERARGSLDVLLSTPLSTFSILVGKWWGAFRLMPHVLVWPALLTSCWVVDGGRWVRYLLLLGLITAYGAWIASLGLASATWVSRLGRAIALCVSLYVVFSFGWLFLITLMFDRNQVSMALVMGSPLFGVPMATSAIEAGRRQFLSTGEDLAAAIGAILWTLVHSGVAAGLFAMVVTSFDRCLGRIADTAPLPVSGLGKKHRRRSHPGLEEWLTDDSIT
jgi:ABC-type transport system involved in multi-copper enzyme maturation permease subunit